MMKYEPLATANRRRKMSNAASSIAVRCVSSAVLLVYLPRLYIYCHSCTSTNATCTCFVLPEFPRFVNAQRK